MMNWSAVNSFGSIIIILIAVIGLYTGLKKGYNRVKNQNGGETHG